MRLSPHFTLDEFTVSGTAARLGINNTPSNTVLESLARLAIQMEKVRALLGGRPLYIHSGYRCKELNDAVGSGEYSYHPHGCAADFDPPPGMTHDEAQHLLAADPDLDYDMILEEGTVKPESEGGSRWIHFQIPKPGAVSRRLVRDATVDRLGGRITRIARD